MSPFGDLEPHRAVRLNVRTEATLPLVAASVSHSPMSGVWALSYPIMLPLECCRLLAVED
jgi:hypothetical protein